MIVIQRLETQYTKRSRGGTAAARRNSTPDALVLPDLAVVRASTDTDNVMLHQVTFHETDFEPSSRVEVIRLERLQDRLPELVVESQPGLLEVRYRWSPRHGAPERPSGGRLRLRLAAWCRIVHNGRQSHWDSYWSYQSTVLNVGFGCDSERVFVETSPTATADHRAELW